MKYIVVKTEGSNEKRLKILPESYSFSAKMPIPMKIKKDISSLRKTKQEVKITGFQLPVVSNNATTGWKLQGASVKSLFIKQWNNSDEKWIYVMLSRVRGRKGLFLESKIDEN